MFEVEDRHWWFRGKRKIVGMFLNLALKPGELQSLALADIGCGTGAMLMDCRSRGSLLGVDAVPQSLEYCRRRGLEVPLVRASADRLPLAASSLRAVMLLDVLYHRAIKSDMGVLREIYAALAPGGSLVLTDSAFMCLYSDHDRAVEARHRYTRGELVSKLRDCGFQVSRSGYYNTLLFLPAALTRLWQKLFPAVEPQSNVRLPPGWLNGLLYLIFSLERLWLSHFSAPAGLSVFVIARKPLY